MQEIRSSKPPVVTGIRNPNRYGARHHCNFLLFFSKVVFSDQHSNCFHVLLILFWPFSASCVTFPFPDWYNVISHLMPFVLNLLFQNFATWERRLKFDKFLSVSKFFVGNPDCSLSASLSSWVALASLLENPYSFLHWNVIPSAASMHMHLIISFPNTLSGSLFGKSF